MSNPGPQRRELCEAVLLALRRLSTRTVMLHETIADRVGMHATDHKCLDVLSQTGPIAAGQLADEAGLTTGATTRLIDRLERGGLVRRERDARDRRQVIIHPVAGTEYQRQLESIFAPLAEATEAELEHYSDAELTVILDFVKRSEELSREQALKLRETPE